MLLQVILEGIGLGVLLILVCTISIRKGALDQIAKGSFHKKHAGRPQRCTQERDHDSKKGFHLSHRLKNYLFLLNPASSRYSGCSFKYGSLSPQMV